jgi:hypothetical protein
MEVCYWALLYMPLVILLYLYSLQIKGDSNKKKTLYYRVLACSTIEHSTINNTFFSATIDKVFYYLSSVLTTCFGPYIKPSSGYSNGSVV